MPTYLAILPIVIGIIVIAVVLSRKNLTSVELLPGEEIIFTDEPVRYKLTTRPKPSLYLFGRVQVTNKRIITAQKALLGRKYVISQVIDYTTYGPPVTLKDMMGGFMFKKGYMEFSVPKENFKISMEKDKQVVEMKIPIDQSAGVLNQFSLLIYTDRTAEYQNAVRF